MWYLRVDPMLLKKIVIAEDDDAIAHMVSMALGDAGYLCLRARDGDEALKLVKAHDPDLLVLDVMMPRPLSSVVVSTAGSSASRRLVIETYALRAAGAQSRLTMWY